MSKYRWGRRLATTCVVAGGAIALLAIVSLVFVLIAMVTSNPFQSFFATRMILPFAGIALLGVGIALAGFVARAVFDIAEDVSRRASTASAGLQHAPSRAPGT